MPQSFFDLEIWKRGYDLALRVYAITAVFPRDEQFGLTQQLRRSCNSVIANIAESQGRYSFQDRIRVLYQARGEIFETRSHVKIAEGLHFLPSQTAHEIDKQYEGLLRGVNTLIRYLASRKHDQ